MKKAQIKKELLEHLSDLGFRQGVNCIFQPEFGQVFLMLDGAVEVIRFKAGMTRRKFMFECGVIAGLVKAHGIKAAAATKKAAVAVNGHLNGAGQGMPAYSGL
jgi:hypothetical protein